MAEKKYGIFSPVLGLKQDYPTVLLKEGYVHSVEDTKDILFNNGRIVAAKKRLKFGTACMPDPILHETKFKMRDNTKYSIVGTKRDIAYYDQTNDRYNFLTQKYDTGKILVTSASDKIYGGLEIDNCDDDPIAWADGSGGDVTPARETTTKKEGTASVKLTVAAGAGVELLAYHNITSIDLTGYDSVGFWFYSSVALNASDLQFLIDDTNGCGTPLETINFPAIAATTWTWVNLTLADPSALGAVLSIGIKQAVDKGAMVLYIDQIVAGDWAGQLKAGDFITIGTTYSTDDTWYEVETVDSDTAITITANYAGSTASQKAYLARKIYEGTNLNYWRSVTFNDKWIATNDGINNVQMWDGNTANLCVDLTGSPPKARYITTFENYVVLGFVYDGGNDYPQQYDWCALGDETNWSTGDSGSATISEPGFIKGFSPGTIEGYKIIGTEDGIYRISLVSGDEVFHRETVTLDFGIDAPDSMVNYGRALYGFCSDNTFKKITLSSWEIISKSLDTTIRGFSPAYKQYIQGVFNVEYGLLLWLVPDLLSNGTLNKILCLDLDDNEAWSLLNIEGACFGTYYEGTSTTWDTLPYATWAAWDWGIWDKFSVLANYLTTLVSDYSGYLYKMFASDLDNGVAYNRVFVLGSDLQEQRGISNFKRLLKIEAFFESETTRPRTIGVQIKGDKQVSWQDTQDGYEKSIVNNQNEITMVKFFFDDIPLARHFLFKFSANNFFRFLGMIVYYDDGYGSVEQANTVELLNGGFPEWSYGPLVLNGSSDYISASDSPDWYFGAGDFTIDGDVIPHALKEQAIYSNWDDVNNRVFLQLGTTGALGFYVASGGVTLANYATAAGVIPDLDVKHHIALVRNGANIYIFVDGVSQTLTVTTAITAATLFPDLTKLYIGTADAGTYTRYFNGQINKLRISKGIARWTANFTPPAEYVLDSYTKSLLEFDGDLLDKANTSRLWVASGAIRNTVVPDNWVLEDSTDGLCCFKESSILYSGSHCLKLVKYVGDQDYIYQNIHAEKGIDFWKGRTITLGAWVKCDRANSASVFLSGGGSTNNRSNYHSGSGEWEYLMATYTVQDADTVVSCLLTNGIVGTTAYFDEVVVSDITD